MGLRPTPPLGCLVLFAWMQGCVPPWLWTSPATDQGVAVSTLVIRGRRLRRVKDPGGWDRGAGDVWCQHGGRRRTGSQQQQQHQHQYQHQRRSAVHVLRLLTVPLWLCDGGVRGNGIIHRAQKVIQGDECRPRRRSWLGLPWLSPIRNSSELRARTSDRGRVAEG